MKDHAWFCGENGEYFSGLFDTLQHYIHDETQILMVLFENPWIDMINGFAERNGFVLNCVHSKKNVLEKNFIFKIENKKTKSVA
jgi:release factor glutamine methyltransferase